MCGIYGSVAISGDGEVDLALNADESVDRLCHRGPDDLGIWATDGAVLGMRRLSIIDIDGGHQPLQNDAGTLSIVYNGELYNFRELREELEAMGFAFRTRSDTEVVLRSFERWGVECLARFNGMFAFAIWDAPARTLFAARDRIGEKPLYYFADTRRLIFASEVKAILADPTVPRGIDPEGLSNFLAFGHAVAPSTMYQGIRKLLPGHYLRVRDGRISTTEYWDVDRSAGEVVASDMSEDGVAGENLSLLDDAVRRRLVADVPVGAFLSGGVDSSAVVALATRHATERMKTFSVGFTIGGAYDELPDARAVAGFLGTDHHELRVDHADLVGLLQKLVYHYDEPFADAAAFPLYLLSEFARRHVSVVLTGDGADELFGGYRRYATDQAASLTRPFLANGFVAAAADRLPRLRRAKRALTVLPIKEPARRYAAWLLLFDPGMQAELLNPEIAPPVLKHDPAAVYVQHYAHLNGGSASDHLNRLMYTDVKTLLADGYMEKTDKATMAASLEARLPILDHRLVELAFRIPVATRSAGGRRSAS